MGQLMSEKRTIYVPDFTGSHECRSIIEKGPLCLQIRSSEPLPEMPGTIELNGEIYTRNGEWHPVDTAPEDGSQILVAYKAGVMFGGIEYDAWRMTVVYFHDGDWQLVETDACAPDAVFTENFELWKPIVTPDD
jgi:hypothetical protein